MRNIEPTSYKNVKKLVELIRLNVEGVGVEPTRPVQERPGYSRSMPPINALPKLLH